MKKISEDKWIIVKVYKWLAGFKISTVVVKGSKRETKEYIENGIKETLERIYGPDWGGI